MDFGEIIAAFKRMAILGVGLIYVLLIVVGGLIVVIVVK